MAGVVADEFPDYFEHRVRLREEGPETLVVRPGIRKGKEGGGECNSQRGETARPSGGKDHRRENHR